MTNETIEIIADQMSEDNDELIDKDTLLIPSGSAMLNLACSDTVTGAYPVGKMVNLIGDSSSGKTFLALTMFMEMSLDSRFDNYRFIYDDVEQANEFDISKLFGPDVANRVEAPANDKDGPIFSDTIQNFHAFITDALDGEKPFVYILDSFDALTSKEEQKFLKENLKAFREGKETTGSYGMEKAKIGGQILRMIISRLAEKNSFLLVISQTRDNISPMAFVKTTRSGGRALKFYASHEIWLSAGEKEKKKERVIGNSVKAKVTKNKYTGKHRDVEFSIYYDYGVDDIRSCIDFLEKEGYLKKEKSTLHGESLGMPAAVKGVKSTLITQIENNNLEGHLFESTQKAWIEIENSLKTNRKKKYVKGN